LELIVKIEKEKGDLEKLLNELWL